MLTMVEATTGWLETYPVPHATAWNTILGLGKQVLWSHGTPERTESDNRTHFKNSLINTWAREHGIEWVYHIPYHAPAAGKVERYNGLLKTTLNTLGGGSFNDWQQHLAKVTWLVNTRGSTNRAGPAISEPLHIVDGDKVPAVHAIEPTFLVFNMVNFLYTVFSFSRMRAENSRGADETPDPGADPVMENPEWCGEWEDIGQILKEFSDPVVWDFPCDQIQNPAEVGKHLKEKCHDDSKEKKIIAVSWALAYAHCTLLDTVGQQREAGGRGDKSAATPVTQAAANTPATQVIAKPDSEPKPAAKPDSEPKPLAVAVGRKHTSKTDRPVDDDDPGEGPSKQGIWDPCHMIQLSIKEYWGGANPHSRWTRLLGSVAQRYLCSDDLYMQQDQWKTIEQGIQCLREMTVAEIIFSDDLTTKNADLVPCTSVMWHKLVRLGPQEYASALAIMKWDEREETELNMAKKL
ncbi:hypothetical protein TURU_083962 [Turdus rufiventris]|nr:hypothetical protein TURU_083962 [Turdus rufiventris]